ncbi:hypothetical protein CDAR_193101 [Caerostris darwini]|uniref:Uncharacterized protein n=1 Tax=Caerostris darwini TaxID=1538125 RepID=A0AAV4N3P9_9ARAC|nr:hypothetical protein CDAR_193101 [Caerostris darwini]
MDISIHIDGSEEEEKTYIPAPLRFPRNNRDGERRKKVVGGEGILTIDEIDFYIARHTGCRVNKIPISAFSGVRSLGISGIERKYTFENG